MPTSGAKSEELSGERQGPDELQRDFVSRLLQAVSRTVSDAETGRIIVKQLAYENANKPCQTALRPHRKTGTLSDFIRTLLILGRLRYRELHCCYVSSILG